MDIAGKETPVHLRQEIKRICTFTHDFGGIVGEVQNFPAERFHMAEPRKTLFPGFDNSTDILKHMPDLFFYFRVIPDKAAEDLIF